MLDEMAQRKDSKAVDYTDEKMSSESASTYSHDEIPATHALTADHEERQGLLLKETVVSKDIEQQMEALPTTRTRLASIHSGLCSSLKRLTCNHWRVTSGAIVLVLLVGLAIFTVLTGAHLSRSASTVDDVYNRTLGYQKIIAIGLPGRTNRRDALTLAASITGVDIEWIGGVNPADIPKMAIPPTWDTVKQRPGALGCWRAHMNALSKVVEENLSSALIFEDDVDWDFFIKQQLADFAVGSRVVQGDDPSGSRIESPYGSDWDLLWHGHCAQNVNQNASHYYLIDDDVTVGLDSKLAKHLFNPKQPFDEFNQTGSRFIYQSGGGTCTTGYAVSARGARKMLAAMSLRSLNEPYDDMMSDFCKNKLAVPGQCIAVWPPLFQPHRLAGTKAQNSDIGQSQSTVWHDEYTFGIKYSTIMNAPYLIAGAETVHAQWPEVEPKDVPLDTKLDTHSTWKWRRNRKPADADADAAA